MFIKVYKQYTEKAKWHYTSKPRHTVQFGEFNLSYSSSSSSVPTKTHYLWLNDEESQAVASEFPDVLHLNTETKQVLTPEQYSDRHLDTEQESESVQF